MSGSHPFGPPEAYSEIVSLLKDVAIPPVVRVRREYEYTRVADPGAAVRDELSASGLMARLSSGQRVAVAVGSRGISNLPAVVRAVITAIRDTGAVPFIVPAMGSHGGATAAGQAQVLASLGITEASMGVPVVSSMETVEIGRTLGGIPVFADTNAVAADAIVIVNRVKPHVAFRGPYESGLMKMLVIGLGKQKGAETCHRLGFGFMAENIPAMGRISLSKLPVVFAVAVIEGAEHDVHRVEVVPAENIPDREPELLSEARTLQPVLPFSRIDVLIIDEIGKDISGTGFDTNAVGRYHTPYCSGGPDVTRMAVLDMTDASGGNANGIGMADFATMDLLNKFRFDKTYPNVLTSTVPLSAKLPVILPDDRAVIRAAVKTCNVPEVSKVRLVRIRNTSNLHDMQISPALIAELPDSCLALGQPHEFEFDDDGRLSDRRKTP